MRCRTSWEKEEGRNLRGTWGLGAASSPGHLCVHLLSGLGRRRGYEQALTAVRLPTRRRPEGATPPPAPRRASAAFAERSMPRRPRSARVPAAEGQTEGQAWGVSQVRPAPSSRHRPTGGAGAPPRATQSCASEHRRDPAPTPRSLGGLGPRSSPRQIPVSLSIKQGADRCTGFKVSHHPPSGPTPSSHLAEPRPLPRPVGQLTR